MDRGDLQIEYVEARRVLLDALTALTGQLDAVVLVGAQRSISERKAGSPRTSRTPPTPTSCSTQPASRTGRQSAQP